MMLMVMTFFYDAKTLVIYSTLPQILTATIGLIRSEKTVDIFFLMKMILSAAAGSVLGLLLFYRFSTQTFYYLLASAISIFGLYLVVSPHVIKINRLTQSILDVLAGISQALFGISGPIAMTRLIGTFSNKLIIRNYALAFFLCLNLFRAGAYLVNDTFTAEIGHMMLVSGPILAIVLWNANHLHLRVNEFVFRKVVSWIMLIGGLSLLLNSPYN